MTSPTASDYTYESESEFDLLLRDARGRVPRDGALSSPRVQEAFTPLHYSTRTMSNPAGVGQPAGNPNLIDQAMALSGITVASLPPLTPTSPAGVGSASNQPISDLFDAQTETETEDEEEAAREAARRLQQRRIRAARGKRPAVRGRPSVSGTTTTTTTTRLPARRPRRPVLAPTPPPRGASSPSRGRGRGRGRLPSVSPGTPSSPGSPSSVRAAAAAANEGDLQQVFQILANDVNNRVQNRRISGITTTNTITTVYKNGRPPSVRRNSTRIST